MPAKRKLRYLSIKELLPSGWPQVHQARPGNAILVPSDSTNSFFDLDYIIDINEKRFKDYLEAYHKVIERFTHLIVIYSAITIFLFPLVQSILTYKIQNIIFIICFSIFISLLGMSVVNTIKFLMPQNIPYLKEPKEFYSLLLSQYQKNKPDISNASLDNLLKASYINELETAQASIMEVLKIKGNLYYKGLTYSLLSAIPYIICLGYHFGFSQDLIQNVRIVK